MIQEIALIAAGSCVGGVARYGMTKAVGAVVAQPFPYSTFVVNIAGCFIIGALAGLLATDARMMKLMFVTGFCGSFTTFSTFSIESLSLLQSGHTLTFAAYVAASVLTGIAAVWAGHAVV